MNTTFRRLLIDDFLKESVLEMTGVVLDVGGRKFNKRGSFRPPLERVDDWKYLNIDKSSGPDYCCSAEKIPLPNASIQTVVMTEVLEYLSNPQLVLKEISRILQKDGRFVMTFPLIHPVHGDWMYDRVRYTEVYIREMVEEAGFTILHIEEMGSLGSVLFDILHVAFGYASEKKKTISKILNRLVKLFSALFIYIDTKSMHMKKYITTGYGLILKKHRNEN